MLMKIVMGVLCTGIACLFPATAKAQLGTSGGLQLSPTSTRVSMEQGQSRIFEFSLKNIDEKKAYIHASVLDFVADENGYPKYLDTTNSTFSARSFLKLPGVFSIDPNTEQKYSVEVAVPEGQPAGVYYSSIIFSTSDSEQKPSSIGGVAGTIVVEVAGSILSSSANILSLDAGILQSNSDVKSGSFFISEFNVVKILIENTGSTYIDPIGKVTLYDSTKKTLGSFEIATAEPQTILPGSKRYITISTDVDINRPGPYTIEAIVGYNKTGSYIRQSATVWYVPTWLMLGVFTVLLVGISWVVRRHTRHHENTPPIQQIEGQ